jgi:hypothetical protein
MFKTFIENLDNSFLKLSNPYVKHTNITNILKLYKPDILNEIVEEYIDNNYNMIDKITETYKNKSCYKFILHRSDKYDIVHIKWEKDFQSDKHQHLKFDNAMYVINDGCLVEHIFKYCNFYDIFIRYNTINLKYGNIEYKLNNDEIHKIIAKEYTETLHINIHDVKPVGRFMRLFRRNKKQINY